MKTEPQILIDAVAVRGELRDLLIAGISVKLSLVIACLFVELRRKLSGPLCR